MKPVLWVLLFLMAWPIFLIVWWLSPTSRPPFVQRVIDLAKTHPKPCAWGGVAFGTLGLIGGFSEMINPDPHASQNNPLGGLLVALAIVVGCGYLLMRWHWQERAALHAEIAARAEEQNTAYLAGDDFGIYGARDIPRLDDAPPTT